MYPVLPRHFLREMEEEYRTAKRLLRAALSRRRLDTFFVRSGDMLAAGVVFVGTHLLTFSVTSFALTNIAFCADRHRGRCFVVA